MVPRPERTRLKFLVLGELEVRAGGEEIQLGGGRQRALLALLLQRRGETISTERLIDALWGERPPPSAVNSIHIYVSQLRKTLGDGRLVTRGRGYALDVSGDELDLERFERLCEEGRRLLRDGDAAGAAAALRDALALWRGPPFGSMLEDPLAIAEAGRVDELRLAALEDRLEADIELGRRDVTAELDALAREHPLRERLRALQMLALYRTGRQAEALEAYRAARRVLADDLGLEPGPALRQLERAILAHDPSLDLATPPRTSRRAQLDSRALAVRGAVVLAAAIGAAIVVLARGTQTAGLTGVFGNAVGILDARSNRIVAQIPVGSRPGSVVLSTRSAWVVNRDDGTVSRIDLRGRLVTRTIPVGGRPSGLLVTPRGVWVTSTHGRLSWIDPRFNELASLRSLELSDFGFDDPRPLTRGFGSVWASDPAGQVERLDPRAGRIVARIDVGMGAQGIAAGAGAVWVANTADGTVSRIDPSNAVVATIPVGHGPTGVALGAGAVWVTDALDGTLVRIDPATNAVTATIPAGTDPVAVAVGAGAVWVADAAAGQLFRVDPGDNSIARSIPVGGSPQALAVAGDSVWFSVSHRPPEPGSAGTLRVDLATDPGPIDPVLLSGPIAMQIAYATCAKLLNYPDAAAPAGSRLVPEVAQSTPMRSADGRTWTFIVRRGFRFSPPLREPVTATTFKYSLERALDPRMRSYAAGLLQDVVGVRAYESGRAAHVSGIVASGDRLTITLTRPAGDLPARLASPSFCAVPVGTPVNPAGISTLPSAGPYYVASYVPGRSLLLRRNPAYRGARPHRLEQIAVQLGVDQSKAVADVEAGRADYAGEGVPLAAVRRLGRRYGARRTGGSTYLARSTLGLRYFALNASRPLFSDARVRAAAALAADRNALAALQKPVAGTPSTLGRATDHYLPPAMPGYRSVHAFPPRPDLVRARKLMRGRRGQAVLWTCNATPCPEQAAILARNLRAIGITVDMKTFPKPVLYALLARPNAAYDIVSAGWIADYPDPASVLAPLFDPDASPGANLSHFRDSRIEHELAAAQQLSGPARYRAYADLDLELTRAAPAIAYATDVATAFFSPRVGCQLYQPVYGIDLTALCLRHSR